MDDIFARARAAITTADIEMMFGPGKWERNEFWCRNPLRADANPGSFSISSKGLYNDFASGDKGHLIDLIAKTRGIEPIAAARLLLRESAPEHRSAPERVPPQPHPDENAYERAVNAYTSARKITAEWGKPTLKSHYYNDNGQPIFTVVRYERLRGGAHEKTVRQVYYGVDGKLHMGLPYPSGRPLWNLMRLKAKADAPVLIVEGEKCAEIGQKALPGYVVMTWCGGALAVDKTDWGPLTGRNVLIWPDNDDAGRKAAEKIKEKLGDARIVSPPAQAREGDDIADYIAAGHSAIDYLRTGMSAAPAAAAAAAAAPTQDAGGQDFERSYTPLGYDEDFHYFLLNKRQTIMTIPVGKFTRSQIIELAKPQEWGLRGGLTSWVYDEKFGYESLYTTKSGGVRQDAIQVLLIEESTAAGLFDPEFIRGTGVWKDEQGRIVVYDGRTLKLQNGQELSRDKGGKYLYVSSSNKCENFFGDAASEAEGREFENMLSALPFQSSTGAVMATGWALISNFAGCLPWRPHIWVTGAAGSGKSTIILDRLIKPLIGDLIFRGSSETTKAATRRGLKNDCRPAIFDEFEPNDNKTMQSMRDVLKLARNASVDSSSESKIVQEDKIGTYYTRSCFCFSSINVMAEGKAVDSRITPIEIRPMAMQARIENKSRLVQMDNFILKNAARLRRRIFKNLHLILEDIEFIKEEMRLDVGSDRTIDQLAPMLAAFYAMTHDDIGNAKRDSIELMAFVRKHIIEIQENTDEVESDEDTVIEGILAHIEMQLNVNTVAQLIEQAADNITLEAGKSALNVLKKLGLHIAFNEENQPLYLHIYPGAKPLKDIFKDTHLYNFAPQLRRHPLAVTSRGYNVKFAAGVRRAIRFDFGRFRERYLPDEEWKDDPPGDRPYAA